MSAVKNFLSQLLWKAFGMPSERVDEPAAPLPAQVRESVLGPSESVPRVVQPAPCRVCGQPGRVLNGRETVHYPTLESHTPCRGSWPEVKR